MGKYIKDIVEKLKLHNEMPKSAKPHTYCLTHTYDEKVRRFYIEAPYIPINFEAICAFVQFECSEIEMSYSMDQTEVIEILEKFYDCKKVKRTQANQVDLYLNWEYFCGSDVQSISYLKRDRMNDYFKKYTNEYLESMEVRKVSVVEGEVL